MACNNLTNIAKSCDNNQGGIYTFFLIDTDSVTGTSVNLTAHTITGISTTEDFTGYDFKRNVGNVTIDPQTDFINGSTFFQITVTLIFHRREASKSRALQVLGEGQRYLNGLFLDANGIYWYLDHLQLSGGAEETGTTKADGSKYTVTFVSQMDTRPYAVTPSIVPALIS